MANNTQLNSGTGGDILDTEDNAGVKTQRVKPVIGAAGAVNPVLPVSNGMDTTATGVPAAGLVAQLDDVATGAVTENQFAPVRLSTRRALLVEGVASGTPILTTPAANSQVDVNRIAGTTTDVNNGVVGAGTQRVTIASDSTGQVKLATGANVIGHVIADSGSTTAVTQATASSLNAQVQGPAAHGASSTGNPEYLGGESIAHGTNPTAVTAGQITKWYFNRAGVPFVMGGHPNIITIELAFTAAQTDVAIVTVASGLKIVVTRCTFVTSHANTVDVAVRVGFGTANTPTTTGVVLSHPNVAAGSGLVEGSGSGILGVGADNEDLRITATVPTTGSARVITSYYTIET